MKKRQKLIGIADQNNEVWAVVDEYESDDLVTDSSDKKRLKKAKKAAQNKRKSSKSCIIDAERFKALEDSQLFRDMRGFLESNHTHIFLLFHA